MKKVQASGAQNRKKKRARYEEQFRQRGALDTGINRSKEQVVEHEEVNDDHDDSGGTGSDSEGSSAAQSEAEHNTVSPPGSPESSQSHSQNDDLCEEVEDNGDFSTVLKKRFWLLEEIDFIEVENDISTPWSKKISK